VDGITYSTFRETCEKRGLVQTDKSLDDALVDAETFQMPVVLRRLFVTILVFCEATNVRELWEKHKDSLSEAYKRDNSNSSVVEQMVLRDIRDILQPMGKDIKNYDLPELNDAGRFHANEFLFLIIIRYFSSKINIFAFMKIDSSIFQ
jgi:hypothetical protein